MGSRMVSMFNCSVQQLKVQDLISFRLFLCVDMLQRVCFHC